MERLIRPVWAEIDLDNIEYNIKKVKELIGNKEILAVVKADAYGHGAVDVAPVLLENGATKLAVAMISEAMELRNNNISAPIVILGYTPIECANKIIDLEIEQTVYNLQYAQELSDKAVEMNKKAKIHVALDTGMGRIGFLPNEDSINDIVKIHSMAGIIIEGFYTHFSSADETDKDYTYEQFLKYQNFYEILLAKGIDIPLKHVANSASIIDLSDTYLTGVRPGIMLYGYYPSNDVKKESVDLKPTLTLKAKISHVKKVDAGSFISYGRTFKTERESIIATLPIGYADGYSRDLSSKGKVIVNGKLANIIGRVCMDQCMIDVTDVGEVKVGDEVILLGEQGNVKFNADDMAEIMDTINYEILCMLKHRIPRVYKKNNMVTNIRNYIG